MKTKGLFPRLWRFLKKLFLILFIGQFVYIIILKWVNPPLTITQLSNWFSGYGLKRDYVSWEEMSKNARLAVIASEDQLFADHNGFDWKSIEKAMEYNTRKPNRVRGASTISQQTAKNVFLWQSRGWVRKGFETYFTFMIELVWGKQRILEVYLNVIEMGPGIFGIEAASQKYFKKPAKSLTRAEAARIAACLPNPKKFKVQPASKYVIGRSVIIQRQMNNLAGDKEIAAIVE
ncbi:monofunctional biosynthetic peptidoglycan transglycosylase [Flavihumibacter stibioxidans]|uniref:monofunctional biosynthetic peptidoglycan transglycosylase n=1 Tax=Flavihumibacter stibioxidans TaxID=1834163 RepID=UPI0031B608B0